MLLSWMEDYNMISEARKRAKKKYNEKVVKVTIEFYPTDAELIKKLQEQPNKQKYIKDLIRKDMEAKG